MGKHLKQVILVRRDLKLKRASIAALAAKASAEFFLDNDESERVDSLSVKLTPQETEWLSTGATRIVLGVPSEEALRTMTFRAELEGLQCYTVGGNEQLEQENKFYSDGILCVAIGPDESSKIDKITGSLKLI